MNWFLIAFLIYHGAAMVYWLSVQTQYAGLLGSNPAPVTIKASLVRMAMGSHLTKSTSPENAQSLVSGFCYGHNGVCDKVCIVVAMRMRT